MGIRNQESAVVGDLRKTDIGEILLSARKQAELSRKDLAEKTKLSMVTIWRIEKGKVIPRMRTLRDLVQVLPIIEELLEKLECIPKEIPNIGEAILYARSQARLSQEDLAEKCGIMQKTISKIETGKEIPHVSTLAKIVQVLPETNLEQLLSLEFRGEKKKEPQTVGMIILFARKCSGLTQEQLAKKAGITHKTISRIELGKVVTNVYILEKIAQVLSITLEEVIEKLDCIPKEYKNLGDMIFKAHGLIFMLNSLVFTICALTIAILIGNIVNSKEAINGIVNVVALGSSFICGAFVPMEWLPEGVLKFAHLLPTYWYIRTNEALKTLEIVNLDTIKPILVNMAVIFGFAILFVFITNIVSASKRRTY